MKRRLFNSHNSSSTTAMRPQLDFSKLRTDYGREKELEQLIEIYDSVSDNEELSTQTVLVHGLSGTGKISLCRSFRDKVSPIYVEGKFDQLAKEPYSGFAEAFTQLASVFSDTKSGEIDRIQKAYLAELEVVPRVKFRISGYMSEPHRYGSLDDDSDLNQSFSNTEPAILSQRAVSLSNDEQPVKSLASTPFSNSYRRQSAQLKDLLDSTQCVASAGAGVSNQLTTATDITSIVPSLRRLIPDTIQTRGRALDNVERSFRSFLRAICRPSTPVMMCLRGLQWADEKSVQLLQYLVRDSDCHGLIIMVCYRDDEKIPSHLEEALHRMKGRKGVTEIHLENLNPTVLHQLVADITWTSANMSKTEELSKIIHQKTNGNPFFSIQFLRMLHEEDYFQRNHHTFELQFDVSRIKSETSVADNVADLISGRLRALPETTQDALRIAACLGSHCDLDVVAAVMGESVSEVKDYLQNAVIENLIDVYGDVSFKWAHDKIQHAAYNLLPEGTARGTFHQKVGKVLKDMIDKKDWALFLAAEHLNRSASQISNDSDKMSLILLNNQAAQRAIESSALLSASEFLTASLKLMGDSKACWNVDHDLSMKICIDLAGIECSLGHFQQCEDLILQILSHAKCMDDKIQAYVTQIESFFAQGNLMGAVNQGLETLKMLGEYVPRKTRKPQLIFDFMVTTGVLKGMTDEEIVGLPVMKDDQKILTMQILSKTACRAWLTGDRELAAALCLRGLKLTCRYGKDVTSAHSFVSFGAMCSNFLNVDGANRFGDISLAMGDNHQQNLYFAARPLFLYCVFVHHLQSPLQQCLNPMLTAYKAAMDSGDMDSAHDCIANYLAMYVIVGLPLEAIQDDAQKYFEQMSTYNRVMALNLLRIYWQYILCFMGDSSNPVVLTGPAMDQEKATSDLAGANQAAFLRVLWTMRLFLAYHFGDFELAQEMGNLLIKAGLDKGHFFACSQFGYLALTQLALARNASPRRQRSMVREAKKHMAVLNKMVKAKNLNAHHILRLCVAEREALKSDADIEEVKTHFTNAIRSASRSGIMHEAAMANERAGLFLIQRGESDRAEAHFLRAMELYSYWGAKAKVEQLKQTYELDENAMERKMSQSEGFLGRRKFSAEEANKHKRRFLNRRKSLS